MDRRLRILGALIAIIGVVAIAGGAYGYTRVQGGANALQGFSAAQNVTISYNDDGQLVDRGTTEGAAAILSLLRDDWKWPVNQADLNRNDPLVNTGTEYMYQMATIAYHTLNSSVPVTLTERTEWNGDGDAANAAVAPVFTAAALPEGIWDPEVQGYGDAVFEAGTYIVPINARYWTAFNRSHPLDGKARELAWTGTVHGLFAELGVGATTASSLEMAGALSLMLAGFGLVFIIAGLGMVWVAWPQTAKVTQRIGAPEPTPAAG